MPTRMMWKTAGRKAEPVKYARMRDASGHEGRVADAGGGRSAEAAGGVLDTLVGQ